jgi:hypothetical protein
LCRFLQNSPELTFAVNQGHGGHMLDLDTIRILRSNMSRESEPQKQSAPYPSSHPSDVSNDLDHIHRAILCRFVDQ